MDRMTNGWIDRYSRTELELLSFLSCLNSYENKDTLSLTSARERNLSICALLSQSTILLRGSTTETSVWLTFLLSITDR